jgi:hypothetical protein
MCPGCINDVDYIYSYQLARQLAGSLASYHDYLWKKLRCTIFTDTCTGNIFSMLLQYKMGSWIN